MTRALLDLTVLATDTRMRGIGRYVGDLARGLAAQGPQNAEVLGVTDLPWLARAQLTRELADAVADLTSPKTPIVSYESWGYRVRLRLAPACRVADADVLHTGHPGATPLGDPGCPRVTTCHDLIPLAYPERYLGWRSGFETGRRLLDRRRYHSADHVICISSATADQLMRLLEVPARNITVVYNGVDLARWSPEPRPSDELVRARYGLAGRRYLLCVGAADWRKNAQGMLSALARVRRRSPLSGLVIAWVGSLPCEQKRPIERLREALGLGDAVKLIDFVSDDELGALYRGAHAQLFVSRAEGFGYPIIEAMACGCPVVTSDCSSMAEIAADAALTVPPEDHQAISEAIVALADAGEHARVRLAGLARSKRFTVERMASETLEVYRSVARR